jgi:hypothetical protein
MKTNNIEHSSGPWDFTEGRAEMREASSVHKKGDKEFTIAHVICESRNQKQRAEDIANARLIAAAPELLEVLEMVATLDRCPTAGEKRQIAAAIAKAKGE